MYVCILDKRRKKQKHLKKYKIRGTNEAMAERQGMNDFGEREKRLRNTLSLLLLRRRGLTGAGGKGLSLTYYLLDCPRAKGGKRNDEQLEGPVEGERRIVSYRIVRTYLPVCLRG